VIGFRFWLAGLRRPAPAKRASTRAGRRLCDMQVTSNPNSHHFASARRCMRRGLLPIQPLGSLRGGEREGGRRCARARTLLCRRGRQALSAFHRATLRSIPGRRSGSGTSLDCRRAVTAQPQRVWRTRCMSSARRSPHLRGEPKRRDPADRAASARRAQRPEAPPAGSPREPHEARRLRAALPASSHWSFPACEDPSFVEKAGITGNDTREWQRDIKAALLREPAGTEGRHPHMTGGTYSGSLLQMTDVLDEARVLRRGKIRDNLEDESAA